MIISIHQPAYLPWLGYLEKIKRSDIFVFLDTVAYDKNSFDNRNRILIDEKEHWLTIPMATAGKFGQTYQQISPATDEWMKSHPKTIQYAYHKAPNFFEYFPKIQSAYDICGLIHGFSFQTWATPEPSLADYCWKQLEVWREIFGLTNTIVKASQLGVTEKGSDLVLEICKKLEATEYYSGVMGKEYLDEAKFTEAGIRVVYQDYQPPHKLSLIHQLMMEGAIL